MLTDKPYHTRTQWKALKWTKLYWSIYHDRQQTIEIDHAKETSWKVLHLAGTTITALWLYIFLCSDGCLNTLCLQLLQHRCIDVTCNRGHHALPCQLTWGDKEIDTKPNSTP